jgi:prepilin-type processing-associated H-X9-DG protein
MANVKKNGASVFITSTPDEEEITASYRCPNDSIAPRNGVEVRRSYTVPYLKAGDSKALGLIGDQTPNYSRNAQEVGETDRTIMMTEIFNKDNRMSVHWGAFINSAAHYNVLLNNSDASPIPHRTRSNYLMVDGHAELLSVYDTYLDAPAGQINAADTMWDAGK